MDSAAAGLLAAVVGVGGTLGSAWLTQRRGDVSRREEWERLEGTRRAEIAAQLAESGREARTAAYTEFNAAARHYLATLNDHSHVLRIGYDPQESLAVVEAARVDYRRRHAEAQMIVPDVVLTEVKRVDSDLNAVYGVLARLTRGTTREGDDIEGVRDAIRKGWQDLSRMRTAMREDLGVTRPSPD
ncbi:MULTISPECIES: hypothetical protein [Streptomyces]|uniref:Secreted protein n=1 Tax=Streptomyces koelreuteriae TaxID=2838015 RepID=A0ABX8FMK8_9ACTN|nr:MULTISPECIES: hypothetical protein [Streptomyces]QWB22287.1 hypothetical protein KJK29_06710 [Streptomyces koelreuteriae]UUA05231.1 hypothetical protein NNW98_06750 [Streptomyces koelreuteriae]UUA12856.1 hypothetical protein NNW99_06750 [Streptomyces sp. CRCS-T-1]